LGDARHPSPQLAKALRAGLQVEQDNAFPFAIDQVERRLDRTARTMGKIRRFMAVFPIVSKQGLVP